MHNHLKRKLQAGDTALGCSISLTSLDAVEVASQLSFDWLWFDTEHAPLDIGALQPLMQANRRENVTPIIRVEWNDPVQIKKALDIGAHGLIIPWVNNVEQAESAVQAAKYPPRGLRGFGPRRASNYGMDTDYVSTANDEIMVITQIETQEAVKNFEDIIAVDGVDAYLIGPNDLAASYGHLGNPGHPEVEEVIADLVERGKKVGVPAGIVSFTAENAQHRIDQGIQLVNIGSDILFLKQGAETMLKALKR